MVKLFIYLFIYLVFLVIYCYYIEYPKLCDIAVSL